MKRQLLITIDAGDVACKGCDFYNERGESCVMFETTLVDDCIRDPRCIEAEKKAMDPETTIEDVLSALGREIPHEGPRLAALRVKAERDEAVAKLACLSS